MSSSLVVSDPAGSVVGSTVDLTVGSTVGSTAGSVATAASREPSVLSERQTDSAEVLRGFPAVAEAATASAWAFATHVLSQPSALALLHFFGAGVGLGRVRSAEGQC